MPGDKNAVGRLATKHLAHSSALLYLFDPTQHFRFRQACEGKSDDPQLGEYGTTNPQEGVLAEAASRIKTGNSLSQQEKCSQPLVVVVTKYDAWSALTNHVALDPGWLIKPRQDGRSGLDIRKLASLSNQVRNVLQKFSPELVAAAEGNFADVTYIPVSALGTTPEVDPSDGKLAVRPRNVNPHFAEVPLLYAMHRSVEGLGAVRHDGNRQTVGDRQFAPSKSSENFALGETSRLGCQTRADARRGSPPRARDDLAEGGGNPAGFPDHQAGRILRPQ